MAMFWCGSLKRILPSPTALPSSMFAVTKRSHCNSYTAERICKDQESSSILDTVLEPHFSEMYKIPSTGLQNELMKVKSYYCNQSQSISSIILQAIYLRSPSASHFTATQSFKVEYKCPSRLPENFSQLVILDNVITIKSFYKCPVSSSIIDFVKAPNIQKTEIYEGPGKSMPAMEAKFFIMRIRHKKMKKHKLKKLRKRMYFVWQKQKLARKARRMAIYYKELEEIKKTGVEFDAKAFVQEQLVKARKGGYHRNIFESEI